MRIVRDFLGTLAGHGAWTKVTIPHYGPPLGRAVTYYRTSFDVTEAMLGKGSLWACFDGVDYKAHVFVNGAYLGSHEGFFAPFEFEFTSCATLGTNTLLVKVENDYICMGSAGGVDGKTLDGDKLYAATGPGYDDPEVGLASLPAGDGHLPGRADRGPPAAVHPRPLRPSPARTSTAPRPGSRSTTAICRTSRSRSTSRCSARTSRQRCFLTAT